MTKKLTKDEIATYLKTIFETASCSGETYVIGLAYNLLPPEKFELWLWDIIELTTERHLEELKHETDG